MIELKLVYPAALFASSTELLDVLCASRGYPQSLVFLPVLPHKTNRWWTWGESNPRPTHINVNICGGGSKPPLLPWNVALNIW